jgi:hypothetical protein
VTTSGFSARNNQITTNRFGAHERDELFAERRGVALSERVAVGAQRDAQLVRGKRKRASRETGYGQNHR